MSQHYLDTTECKPTIAAEIIIPHIALWAKSDMSEWNLKMSFLTLPRTGDYIDIDSYWLRSEKLSDEEPGFDFRGIYQVNSVIHWESDPEYIEERHLNKLNAPTRQISLVLTPINVVFDDERWNRIKSISITDVVADLYSMDIWISDIHRVFGYTYQSKSHLRP